MEKKLVNRIGNRYLGISIIRYIAISSRLSWRREFPKSGSKSSLFGQTHTVSDYWRLLDVIWLSLREGIQYRYYYYMACWKN